MHEAIALYIRKNGNYTSAVIENRKNLIKTHICKQRVMLRSRMLLYTWYSSWSTCQLLEARDCKITAVKTCIHAQAQLSCSVMLYQKRERKKRTSVQEY